MEKIIHQWAVQTKQIIHIYFKAKIWFLLLYAPPVFDNFKSHYQKVFKYCDKLNIFSDKALLIRIYKIEIIGFKLPYISKFFFQFHLIEVSVQPEYFSFQVKPKISTKIYRLPVYPLWHTHLYPFTKSTHLASFTHGLLRQSSMLISQCSPVYPVSEQLHV